MHTSVLPMQYPKKLVPIDLPTSHAQMNAYLTQEKIDVFIFTAQDAFMSEYCPLEINERYAVSGFKGSTGDGLFFSKQLTKELGLSAQFLLFVDGRYHVQADIECKPEFVKVHKQTLEESGSDAIEKWFTDTEKKQLTIGISQEKFSYNRYLKLLNLCEQKNYTLKKIACAKTEAVLGLTGWRVTNPIIAVAEHLTGRTLSKNMQAVQKHFPAETDKCCYAIGTGDEAAWFLAARGFHLPHSAAVLSYIFVVGKKVFVFLPQESATCALSVANDPTISLQIIRNDILSLKECLSACKNVTHILLNGSTVNSFLPDFLRSIWESAQIVTNFDALTIERAQKTEQEIASFKDSCLRASKAIANTMRWVKDEANKLSIAPNNEFNELSLSNYISLEYAKQGASSLSFGTIAAREKNGANIHYAEASAAEKIKQGDLVLLDSGAYFAAGLATDCTRTVLAGCKAEAWQKEIYTTVVRAVANMYLTNFPDTTPSSVLDARSRDICKQAGFNYAHGTGHGVGIGVHENGARLSSASQTLLPKNCVVSVEPGIYLEGKGGVRIENLAVVAQDSLDSHTYFFDNIIWVGFDWDLMDLTKITTSEKKWLKWYESKCKELGTDVTQCPL